ncbi:DUF1153 domain-containing protein [Halomonas sp. OfavH-34-E]|uniref:DUF1153 domain-containing protein n=1 Tax=Halomonas sp. OfavH-34-E TaxID=2954491 RepID=UPI002096A5B3|nr:DUF1153 domain-containing protein [Halomonas sp. OfavH-34-E]MCO7217587.1 DUF1153 domain-containing protein [Halomonas sp. OfavH-34-E]
MTDDNPIKRWTAKRKASVLMDIFKGKTTAAEVASQYDLTVSEIEGWVDEAQRSLENGFKARPKDIREQYESELRKTKEKTGRSPSAELCAKKIHAPARRWRRWYMVLDVHHSCVCCKPHSKQA